MATEEKKRYRKPDFSKRELEYLSDLVFKYKHILECKETDSITVKKRRATWEILANEFNDLPEIHERSTDQLKMCWQNLKRRSKKSLAANKRLRFQTGGGISADKIIQIDDLTNKVIGIVQEQFHSVPNPSDDDTAYNNETEVTSQEFQEKPQDISYNPHHFIETDKENQGQEHQNNNCNKKGIKKMAEEFHHERLKLLRLEHEERIKNMREEHRLKMQMIEEERKLKNQLLKLQISLLQNNNSCEQ